VREAFRLRGLNYDAQKQTLSNYDIQGKDAVCGKPVANPKEAGEIWIEGGDIMPLSSPLCTFMGIRKVEGSGKKVDVAYLFDQGLGIKVFADRAFYAVSGSGAAMEVQPFLLKKDAEASAAKSHGAVATYEQVLAKLEK
jgi:NitT/TauT family transport system substrate-binding protein